MKAKSVSLLATLGLILLVLTVQAQERTVADGIQAVALGAPGTTFHLVEEFGTVEAAYIADGDHFNVPYSVTIDGSDNIWVAEWSGGRVLKFNSAGVFQLSVGHAGQRNGGDELLSRAVDTAIDASGNIWVSDNDLHIVAKFDSSGMYLSDLGTRWDSGNDNNHFSSPRGVAFDSSGNLYVSDRDNHRIQIFNSSGVYVATLGETGVSGTDNAHFNKPYHIHIDGSNRLYVADAFNYRVQIFNAANPLAITYIATLGVTGVSGTDNDHFAWAPGVSADSSKIYVADVSGHRVQIFDATTFAYLATIGTGSPGTGNNAFDEPNNVDVDSSGNIYVSEWANLRVQKFNSSYAYVSTMGTTGVPYLTDSQHFNTPYGLIVDDSGNIFLTEELGNRLIKLNSSGQLQWSVGEAGVAGSDNVHLARARGVTTDGNGNVYVADHDNHRVQIYDSGGGYVATLGGSWGTGIDQFKSPSGVAVGPNGRIFVADTWNHRVQVFDSNHVYATTLGVTGTSGTDNAHFNAPHGIYVDANGTVYVPDSDNSRVQIFNSNLNYQMTLGTPGAEGDDFDHFSGPHDVDVDDAGNIYVADSWNNRIQVFDSSGAYLTTLSGAWGARTGETRAPRGVAVDKAGNVYVADTDNHRIHKYAPGTPGWKQVNLNGFGKSQNRAARSLGSFGNVLYVGTTNYAAGTEVYRYVSGVWEQVVSGGFGESDNVSVNWFAEFNGAYYAGTWNNAGGGGQLWRSPTGNNGSWTKVVDAGFGDVVNADVNTLAEFNGYLYAGTWSSDTNTHGAQVWRSTSGDSGSWTLVAGDTTFGESNNMTIVSMEIFNNYLYIVTDNGTTGGEVWRTSNGTSWAQVNADGFGTDNNIRVTSLASFAGSLYAGTRNKVSGAQLWRSANGTSWTQVIGNGFGKVSSEEIASLAVFDNQLLAIVNNTETGAEVWRSATGNSSDWRLLIDTGLGNGNGTVVNWDNIMAVVDNKLFLATSASSSRIGGRVWLMQRQIYLPAVLR